MQHARNERDAILHTVIHLAQKEPLALQRGFKALLAPLTLDRHAENIGSTLQEGEIVLAKLIFRAAIDFEHAEGLAITPNDHIHRAPHAMALQQLGRSEALLVIKMVRDHGRSG